MKLVHFGNDAVLPPLRGACPGRPAPKPEGALWVSDEDEEHPWSRWTAEHDFARGTYAHEITLWPCNLLHIVDYTGLLAFTRRYGTLPAHTGGVWATNTIRWDVVMQQYDTVLISPYEPHPPIIAEWYRGWDCASGVILRPDRAVKSIRRMSALDTH